jgi:hypothetical protein
MEGSITNEYNLLLIAEEATVVLHGNIGEERRRTP